MPRRGVNLTRGALCELSLVSLIKTNRYQGGALLYGPRGLAPAPRCSIGAGGVMCVCSGCKGIARVGVDCIAAFVPGQWEDFVLVILGG